jgi:hypothetical protein
MESRCDGFAGFFEINQRKADSLLNASLCPFHVPDDMVDCLLLCRLSNRQDRDDSTENGL